MFFEKHFFDEGKSIHVMPKEGWGQIAKKLGVKLFSFDQRKFLVPKAGFEPARFSDKPLISCIIFPLFSFPETYQSP